MRALNAGIFTTLLLLGSAATAQKLTRGPYLQWVTGGTIVVAWDQDAPSTPEVRYGLQQPLSQVSTSSASGTHHEVTLSGLQAGSIYTYAVYQGNKKLSAELSFRSAPPPSAPFRFLAFGDTRSDHVEHQKQVYAMTLEQDVGFYVNTGDLVASGDVQSDWDTFFTVEYPLISYVPLFPVIGNHDEDSGDYSLFAKHFVIKGSSPAPEAYYAFSYGNSRFVVLDSHVHVDPWYLCILQGKLYDGCFKAGQLNWLKQELQQADADPAILHIFILIHIGPYSSKQGRAGNAQMRELLPLFKTHKVTLILSGHDHYYERGTSGNGIPYVITGGGGAPIYAIGAPSPQPHTVATNSSVHHYCVFDVNGVQIDATVKTADGKTIDTFQITGTTPPAPDGGTGPADSGPPQLDTGWRPDALTPPSPDSTGPAQPDAPPPSVDGPPATGPIEEDGGCSCQVKGSERELSGALSVLLLLGVLLLRRNGLTG
jgi:hypothetical protein